MKNKNRQEEFIEIDLREYIMVLFNKWKLIVGIATITVLLAGVYAFLIADPVYQVESELMRSEPSYQTDFNSEIFSKREYRRIFTSSALAEEVIKKLNLDTEKYNSDKLLNNVTVIVDNAGEDEEATRLINIKYNTTKPETGQNIVNTWIELFEQRSLNLLREEVKSAQETITNQYNTYKQEVNQLQTEYDEFQSNSQIDLLKNKISKRENKIVNYEDRLLDIKTEISRKAAAVKETKQALEAEQEIYELNRATFDEELTAQWNDLGIGQIKTEELNPIYQELKRKVNNSQSDLEQLKAERKILSSSLDELNKEVEDLKVKLTIQQRRLKELKLELDSAETRYSKLYEQQREANTALEVQTDGLRIASEAVEPEQPSKPNKKLIVAIAGVLGLMLGVFAAFGTEFITSMKEDMTVQG